VAVGAAVAWVVVVVEFVVVVVPVAVDVPPSVVVVEPAVVTAAVETSVEAPPYERAAMAPNPPTAAMLAILLPIVRARRRATARSRSAGLRRVADFMTIR